MKTLFGLLVLFSIGSQPAFAKRTVSTIPISISGTAANAIGTICKAGTSSVAVAMTNVSTQTQSVTITIADEATHFDLFVINPGALSGWNAVDAPNGWFNRIDGVINRPSSSKVKKMVLSPLGKGNLSFTINLNVSPNVSSSSLSFDVLPSGPGFPATALPCPTTNCWSGGSFNYNFRLVIEVEEDAGAVLAGLSTTIGLFPIPNPASLGGLPMQINGGRPF
jgi:hypothetical protein